MTQKNYQTTIASGYALLQLLIPDDSTQDDIADLRAWLSLIDRQLLRLETLKIAESALQITIA